MNGPVLIVGDTLLDVDVIGAVTRLAPDAPVPVVETPSEKYRPGGAGLAALTLHRRGVEVVLATALGQDAEADVIRRLLVDIEVIELERSGATCVKRRVQAGAHTLLRIDSGDRAAHVGPPSPAFERAVNTASAILASDYAGGTLTEPTTGRALAGHARHRPVVWDPHPRGSRPVSGATLATPSEAEAGDRPPGSLASDWGVTAVAVTLGDRGALLGFADDEPPALFPAAPLVGIRDTCGAGDAFAAAATAALGRGDLVSSAITEAVEEAGRFVAAGAAAQLLTDASPGRETVVATGGCFDLLHAGHVALLTEARRLGDRLVVLLNSDESVRRLKGTGRPLVPAADRARVLAALACVDDVIVFDEDAPDRAIRRLRPDLWVKGGDYTGTQLPEADTLAEWGARAVILPYLAGRSTTELVRRAHPRTTEGAAR